MAFCDVFQVRPKRFPRAEARKDLNEENHIQSELVSVVSSAADISSGDCTTTKPDQTADSSVAERADSALSASSPAKKELQWRETHMETDASMGSVDEEEVKMEDSDSTDDKQSKYSDDSSSGSDQEDEDSGMVDDRCTTSEIIPEESSSLDQEVTEASQRLGDAAGSAHSEINEDRDVVLSADVSDSLSLDSPACLDLNPQHEELSSPAEDVGQLSQHAEQKDFSPSSAETEELDVLPEEVGDLSTLPEEDELHCLQEEVDGLNLPPEQEKVRSPLSTEGGYRSPQKADEVSPLLESGKASQFLKEEEGISPQEEVDGLSSQAGDDLCPLSKQTEESNQLPEEQDLCGILSEEQTVLKSPQKEMACPLPEETEEPDGADELSGIPVSAPAVQDEDSDGSSSFESSFLDFQTSPLRAPRPPTPLSPSSSLDGPGEENSLQMDGNVDGNAGDTLCPQVSFTEVQQRTEPVSTSPAMPQYPAQEESPLLGQAEAPSKPDSEMPQLPGSEEKWPQHTSMEYSSQEHLPQDPFPQQQYTVDGEKETPCVSQPLTSTVVERTSPAQNAGSQCTGLSTTSALTNMGSSDVSSNWVVDPNSGSGCDYFLQQEKSRGELCPAGPYRRSPPVNMCQRGTGSQSSVPGYSECAVDQTSGFMEQTSSVSASISVTSNSAAHHQDTASSLRSSSMVSQLQEQSHSQCSEAQAQFIPQHSSVQTLNTSTPTHYLPGIVASQSVESGRMQQGYSLQYTTLPQPPQPGNSGQNGPKNRITPPFHMASSPAVSITSSLMQCMTTAPVVGLQPQASPAVLMGGVTAVGAPGMDFQQPQRPSPAVISNAVGQTSSIAANLTVTPNVAFDPSVRIAPSPGPFAMYNLCEIQRPVVNPNYFGNPGLLASLQPAQVPLQTGVVNMTVPHHAFPQQLQQNLPRANIFLNNYQYNSYLGMNNVHRWWCGSHCDTATFEDCLLWTAAAESATSQYLPQQLWLQQLCKHK